MASQSQKTDEKNGWGKRSLELKLFLV